MDDRLIRANTKTSGIKGFVPFVAIALWFLLAIMSASPAAAANNAYLLASDVLPDIEVALSAKGMAAEAVVEIDNPQQPISMDFAIVNTSYNPLSGRFVVRLNGGGAITGFAKSMHTVPVLRTNMQRGDIIAENDIVYREITAVRANQFLTSTDDLSGMIVRRQLNANTPIRPGDVEAPILVDRGAIVTLSYKMTGLTMTHQGVAADKGAKGDVVSVRNIASDRTLKGIVTDRNFITIVPRGGQVEG